MSARRHNILATTSAVGPATTSNFSQGGQNSRSAASSVGGTGATTTNGGHPAASARLGSAVTIGRRQDSLDVIDRERSQNTEEMDVDDAADDDDAGLEDGVGPLAMLDRKLMGSCKVRL